MRRLAALRDQRLLLPVVPKGITLGALVGVLSGTASALFLVMLQLVTTTRLAYGWLVWLLPVGGLAVGWLYHRYAGDAARGNNLVIEALHGNANTVPLRMAPLVLLGTLITHLFGGSAGREGTAIQMGASLADTVRRVLRLDEDDRRAMLLAGISGGFGSVFGTPVAGFVFALEVSTLGRIRYDSVIPCLTAALVGDLVTRAWGATHAHYPALMPVAIDAGLLVNVALAGAAFGLTSLLFIELTHAVKRVMARAVEWSPLRPVVGAAAVLALMLLVGSQDYLGLSLPLIERSLDGSGVPTFAFLLKLVFTAVTLGSGFVGGEVTPLFVIGSTLGYTLGLLLGVDPSFMAAIGFVAVFAGAANTPLACALMGLELFGGSPVYLTVGCFVAYLVSGHRSIYTAQRVGVPKSLDANVMPDELIADIGKRR